MSLNLYNTLTRSKDVFTPLRPDRVTVYVCGPTVYNHAHIGNARPAVVFDVLVRLLRTRHDRVIFARNVTDVDDKINAAAKATGQPISAITEKYATIYRSDMAALGVAAPDVEPHATAHIPQIIALIERLIASGHAYTAEGHVLFNVPAFAAYGKLSGRDRDDMIAGARVDVAPYKKDPADFVLWKPSTDDLPGWPSPWGRGRPGWHIECSAMIATHLGETIDIHGGGNDLIFPHHENELAQSACAHHGAPLAGVWMHNGFLTMDKEKMSKSLGNIVTVHELLTRAPGEAIRWALLSAHYRQPLDWSDDVLAQAKRTLDRFYLALDQVKGITATPTNAPNAMIAALDDDLNTPKAAAEIAALVKALNGATTDAEKARLKGEVLAAGKLLGILQQEPSQWLTAAAPDTNVDAGEIERLIAARIAARKAKDFKEADRIRDQIAAMGVVIEDRADGTRWRLAS
ncbi:MAG: cysteine--tRNA ligase [Alphaproteobacteria bacterium]|nr:cysteine--tRNA ligase [Alphaproteobacteria bacterium]